MTPAHPPAPAEEAAAVLADWRRRGLHAADPARFAFIEALARRTEAQPEPVRRLLAARLAGLMAAYAEKAPATTATTATTAGTAAAEAAPPPGPLAALVADLARQNSPLPAADGHASIDAALASLGGPPDLKAMGYFRSTWTRLSAERRLTQSLARVPVKAGPLNSQALVHQTLAVMRELSPGYLDRFLDYTDTLMWLERAQAAKPAASSAARGEPPRTAQAPRKTARGRNAPGKAR